MSRSKAFRLHGCQLSGVLALITNTYEGMAERSEAFSGAPNAGLLRQGVNDA